MYRTRPALPYPRASTLPQLHRLSSSMHYRPGPSKSSHPSRSCQSTRPYSLSFLSSSVCSLLDCSYESTAGLYISAREAVNSVFLRKSTTGVEISKMREVKFLDKTATEDV